MAGKKAVERLHLEEQTRIIESEAKRVLVAANAGVGKTTTLALRALRAVSQGADPSRIIFLAYSRPGSLAIRRTLRKCGASAAVVDKFRIGTFDEFAAARLRRLETFSVPTLSRPEEVRGHVLQAISAAREDAAIRWPGSFQLGGSGELAVESLLDAFERVKGTMALERQVENFRLTPGTAADLDFDFTTLAIFQRYERQRKLARDADGERVRYRYIGDPSYDLACMLASAEPAFAWENHPMRLGEVHGLYVDEFHDMNRAMATVLQNLMALYPDAPFTGAGDVDQVIHAASGAESYFLRDGFAIEFGPVERMPLSETLRFGRQNAAMLGRFADKRFSAHPSRESAVRVLEMDSAAGVARHIQAVTEELARDGFPASELAVLLRHPSTALELEYHLLDTGCYYEAVGFTPYMSRPEVLFVRMILSAAVGFADAFTPASAVQAMLTTAEFVGGELPLREEGQDLRTTLARARVDTFQDRILQDLLQLTPRRQEAQWIREAMAQVRQHGLVDLRGCLEALLIERLARHVFVNLEDIQGARESVLALDRMARHGRFASVEELLRVIRAQEENAESFSPSGRSIVLSTIEQAKGLEFERVIVPDVGRGVFDGDDEDERNLFYVAASRARAGVDLIHRPGEASSYLSFVDER